MFCCPSENKMEICLTWSSRISSFNALIPFELELMEIFCTAWDEKNTMNKKANIPLTICQISRKSNHKSITYIKISVIDYFLPLCYSFLLESRNEQKISNWFQCPLPTKHRISSYRKHPLIEAASALLKYK